MGRKERRTGGKCVVVGRRKQTEEEVEGLTERWDGQTREGLSRGGVGDCKIEGKG